MKKLATSALIILILSFMLSSCNEDSIENKYLRKANEVLPPNADKARSDSALMYLDSIKDIAKLSESDRMRYWSVLVQAKYNTDKDISKDTMIYEAAEYYGNKPKSYELKSRVNFLACHVARLHKTDHLAMEYILQADKNVAKTDLIRLGALINSQIGILYSNKNVSDSSTRHHKEALKVYRDIGNEEYNQILTLQQIAANYSTRRQHDTALYYNRMGLEIAEKINNDRYRIKTLRGIGIDYIYSERSDSAKAPLFRALSLAGSSPSPDRALIYLNLSRMHYNLNNIDSAEYYIKATLADTKAKNIKDKYLSLAINAHLSKLREKQGNHKEALSYFKASNNNMDTIRKVDRSTELFKAKRKYDLENTIEKLVEVNERNHILLLVMLGTIAMLIVLALIIMLIRNKHKHEKQRSTMLNKQVENVVFVNGLYKFIVRESSAFEKEVADVSLNYSIKEKSKGYDQIQGMLKKMKGHTQEYLNNSALKFLEEKKISKTIIKSLSTSDLLFISLSQCKYEIKDMASILGVKPNTLHMRKQRLIEKLIKLGVSDSEIGKIIL